VTEAVETDLLTSREIRLANEELETVGDPVPANRLVIAVHDDVSRRFRITMFVLRAQGVESIAPKWYAPFVP
jgi:hypothetical protein